MWISLILGCALEALTGVFALAIWIRLRDARQVSRRTADELSRLQLTTSELKGQLASHEMRALQQHDAILRFDQGMSAKCRELGAFSERCIWLERQRAEAQERLAVVGKLGSEKSARIRELEELLEIREEELHRRAGTIDRLLDEAAVLRLETEKFGRRRGDFEVEQPSSAGQAQELPRGE